MIQRMVYGLVGVLLMSGWMSINGEEYIVPDELLDTLEIENHEQQQLEDVEIHVVSLEEMNQLAALTEEEITEWIGEDDGTIEWRYQLWEMTEDYPDNVGYVAMHEDQETYIIGLVENNEERQAEILELVPQSGNIEFEEAAYSYNELQATQEELANEWLERPGVLGVGIGWSVEDGEITGFGESGNEMRVVVQVSPEEEANLTNQLEAEYGELVYIEVSEGMSTYEDGAVEESEEAFIEESAEEDADMAIDEPIEESIEEEISFQESTPPQAPASGESDWLFHTTIFTFAALVVMMLYFFIRNGTIHVKQFVTGGQSEENRTLSKEEVENQVSKSNFEPSEDVYHSLMEKVFDKKE